MKTVLGVAMSGLALAAIPPAFTDCETRARMLTSEVCNLLMRPILLGSSILAMVDRIALHVIAREPELPAAPAAA